ncbi:hypothetical protein HOLleu_09577 [Holothuria leucospilota]|uniref:Uncharacterized protein n=1 Tax=Holothuria leucospilota TaxID=206669 RepID=A0A9Q1HDZ9_HOLLE|nr:hypothetical protein HOLleu_09577 [Holothuria leucospilota]
MQSEDLHCSIFDCSVYCNPHVVLLYRIELIYGKVDKFCCLKLIRVSSYHVTQNPFTPELYSDVLKAWGNATKRCSFYSLVLD